MKSRLIYLICKCSFNLFAKCVFGSSQLVCAQGFSHWSFYGTINAPKNVSLSLFPTPPLVEYQCFSPLQTTQLFSPSLSLFFFFLFLARIRCPPLSWWIIPPAGWRVQRSALQSGTTDPYSSEYLWNPSVFQLAFILIFMSAIIFFHKLFLFFQFFINHSHSYIVIVLMFSFN